MGLHERHRILSKLKPEIRKELEGLLQYPTHTAGGIMTTEFVQLDPSMSVADALKHIRSVAREKESIYACYVMEPKTNHLLGAVSLRDLVMADLEKPVSEVMWRKPITVNALDDQEAVAKKIAKYNLLAVPVLEKDQSVVGFVTVDDVIDVLVEEHHTPADWHGRQCRLANRHDDYSQHRPRGNSFEASRTRVGAGDEHRNHDQLADWHSSVWPGLVVGRACPVGFDGCNHGARDLQLVDDGWFADPDHRRALWRRPGRVVGADDYDVG